ncbi:MAG: hypothetical protein A2Z31_01575 [candidate division NC10 bacterium RBG_16_65_8]|nr:MAG: hypothetical protein A2Z31_01575 [candidate division NC10 bacterium RBG_16_65_8]
MNTESQPLPPCNRLEGRYANYFEVGHNAFEFVLDFGQFYPTGDLPQFHTRIVTSPAHARALLVTLTEALERHRQIFGPRREGEP